MWGLLNGIVPFLDRQTELRAQRCERVYTISKHLYCSSIRQNRVVSKQKTRPKHGWNEIRILILPRHVQTGNIWVLPWEQCAECGGASEIKVARVVPVQREDIICRFC
jgi:hypothetical protein